jgi:hypothetical protein
MEALCLEVRSQHRMTGAMEKALSLFALEGCYYAEAWALDEQMKSWSEVDF